MPAKNPPTGTASDLNLTTLSALFTDEAKAREFLESQRWPDGKPVCPHCGGEGYALVAKSGSKRPGRPGLKKCKDCRQQFTVRVGTIFEESKLPLRKWLVALHLMTSSKKGVSSHQIARELGITVKSAWFLTMRIREAMRTEGGQLTGTVELDETYVGGKPRFKGQSKRGRGADKKKPVMVLVERDGNARSMPVERVDSDTLKGEARRHVAPEATIMTDEWPSYTGLGSEFAGHEVVCHSRGEYAKPGANGQMIHTNTAESFFALLKRGWYGIFHWYSRQHTHRYCDEFSFRWDQRKVSDGERMVAAIKGAEGKRLMYG
jgi:transposase-like protein